MPRRMKPEPKKVPSKTKARAVEAQTFISNEDRAKAMRALVEADEYFGQASEVLTLVRSVPTRFVQVDKVTGVGGWPVERFTIIHGPSNEGKTSFALGLGLSFLELGHYFHHVDAEFTTPADWLVKLMREHALNPCFRALRPDSYEQTVDAVTHLNVSITKAKKEGKLPDDVSGLIVVDSLKKLNPKRLLDNLLKTGADGETGAPGRKKDVGVDGMGGRAGQYKAALNSQWLDSIVPQLAKSGLGFLGITRETPKQDAKWGEDDFNIGGGSHAIFDASIRARTLLEKDIIDEEGHLLGQQHKVEIRKTKVGSKTSSIPVAFFHTSTGLNGVPEGFDRARDVLDLGIEMGLVEVSGSWVKDADGNIGQGLNKAVRNLTEKPERLAAIEKKCRDTFAVESRVQR
jgi:recombination protein RecA